MLWRGLTPAEAIARWLAAAGAAASSPAAAVCGPLRRWRRARARRAMRRAARLDRPHAALHASVAVMCAWAAPPALFPRGWLVGALKSGGPFGAAAPMARDAQGEAAGAVRDAAAGLDARARRAGL